MRARDKLPHELYEHRSSEHVAVEGQETETGARHVSVSRKGSPAGRPCHVASLDIVGVYLFSERTHCFAQTFHVMRHTSAELRSQEVGLDGDDASLAAHVSPT